MPDTEPLTPDADLDRLVGLAWATAQYPNDLDLGLRNWDDMGGSEPSQERAEFEIALEPLLARVRTAEAERDEVQRRLGVIADSAQDGLADCDDDHDMSAYWVLMVATGQDEENANPRPHASQSTPMHCPSCDGYQTAVMDDGQRSVGVCEGIAPRMVETVEDWETIRAALARRAEMVTPGLDMSVIEEIRRAIPPTPDEVRRLAAKIIARERPLLDRLAEHDEPEEDHRG